MKGMHGWSLLLGVGIVTSIGFIAHRRAPAAHPPITAMAFSPAGDSLVVGSQAGLEVRPWPSLQGPRKLETELSHIHAVAFSSDGQWLAVAGGLPAEEGVVEVYTWPEAQLLFHRRCHDDVVYAVAWQSDGAAVATASLDRSCQLLDAQTGKTIRVIQGHSRGVTAVCFLPDDATLITAGIDQSVRVWRASSGEALRTLNNHTQPVHDLAVRPQNASGPLPEIVSVGSDRSVRLWQPTTGRMMRFARLPSIPQCVTWSSDGACILVGCRDGHVRVIDPDSVEVLHDWSVVDGWAYSLAVHPQQRQIVVGGRNGQMNRKTWTTGD